jgi:predicted membrane-bound spermidine synthase
MAFLICQSVLMAYTGLAVLALVRLPAGTPVVERLVAYWRGVDIFELGRAWSPFELVTLYLVLPVFLYGLPTVLMGFSFGVLQRAVQDDRRTAGRKVGVLQMANIAGNVAGSLVAALVLLNWFGAAVTLKCLLALALVFPIVGWRAYPNAWRFPVAVAGIGTLIALFPTNDELWGRLHGRVNGQALIAEDATGVVALTAEEGGQWRVSVDGKSHSWVPFGSIHSTLGAVAAAIHPAPRDVAIIGLGSGDTAWAAASRPETERLLVYELLAPEKRLLDELAAAHAIPNLRSFLSDPRLQIVTADGRNALARSERRFDIIEADAQRPTTAYAGNLYSVEFFRLCASRLKPDGIMTQWAPTPRIHRTFRDVFPHVIGFPDGIIVGSNAPLAVDPDAWVARLRVPAVQAYLGPAIVEQVASTLSRHHPGRSLDLSWLAPNEDLFPRDEFLTPISR